MFAVIRTGGKQYRVSENDRLEVEKLAVEAGTTVRLDNVLMVGGGADGAVRVGAPVLDDAAVFAEVVEHKRGDKVLIFKKRRRKNSRRLRGHRQSLTVLRITGISGNGEDLAEADVAPVPAEASVDADADAALELAAAPPAADAAADTAADAAADTATSDETR